jgi:signal transduction histidine kinase
MAVVFDERASPVEQPHGETELRDELTAVVAHEMRNLLAPVSNALALLAHDTSPGAVQVRQLISRRVVQMRRLVDDLLDLTRGEHGLLSVHRAPVDLREVIAEALEVAAPEIVAGRHRWRVAGDRAGPAVVDGDRCRLVQVVSNLLLNAVKFTPEGGEIHVLLERAAGCATIRIRDTGIGIDADALGRIFKIYERGRRQPHSHGGVGIGLAIARHLVEAHGGTLTAYSAGAGKGSEFAIRLPIDGRRPAL